MRDLFAPEPPPLESSLAAANLITGGRMFRYDFAGEAESPASQLELAFAKAIGSRFALAVNSCGSALQLALICCGAKPGDLVLVPAFTFTAVISAIVNCGCQPVLVDIDDDYCINTDDLNWKCGLGAKFLLLSYMRGRVARIDQILEISRRFQITIIEDCAHSLGSGWSGKPTGVFGQVSCFSFHDKLLSSGEGGMLVTNSEHILMRAAVMSGTYEQLWRRHSSHPQIDNPYQGHVPQFSMRMNAVTAAILLPQVSRIDEYSNEYRNRYQVIRQLLSTCRYLRLPNDDASATFVGNTVQFELVGMRDEQIDVAVKDINNLGIPLAHLGVAERNDRCVWNWHYLRPGIEITVPGCLRILRNTCDLRLRRTMSNEDLRRIGSTIISCVVNAASKDLA